MGVIIEELRRLLERHLQDHGVAVWFDYEQHYEPILGELALPNCPVIRYTDSFFRLREQAEPWIRGSERPRLLVYLPLKYEEACLPLAELVALGETLRPGEKGVRNTKLAVIARRALKGLVPESRLENLEREIEKNQVSLRELEELAAGGGSGLPTVLGAIFGASHVEEAALAFLSSSERDAELVERNAVPELVQVLRRDFDAPLTPDMPAEEIRRVLARHVLTAEFLAALGDEAATPALSAGSAAKAPGIARRCADLAANWRNRLDLAPSYAEAAKAVEPSLHLEAMSFRLRRSRGPRPSWPPSGNSCAKQPGEWPRGRRPKRRLARSDAGKPSGRPRKQSSSPSGT